MSTSRMSQNLVLILVALIAALTGGAIVRAADRAKGIHVQLAPGGEEVHVWNSTTSTWPAARSRSTTGTASRRTGFPGGL